uniref:Selenoprotein W n=1 Tax=Callorhinchus milii TaxID=7868 RepID=A0A4W3HG06_CALMI
MGLQIHVVFCGSCGYKSKFLQLKKSLEVEFPGELEITGEGTQTRSGKFEVVTKDGKVLHSKENGEGFVDNDKLQKIVAWIQAALRK